jgi:hypothetical protein
MSLPPVERRTLARRLLQESADTGEEWVAVILHRFAPSTQTRMDELLTKSNEGVLTAEERTELTSLVAEYERMMLANTEALLQASQPELFDAAGRLVRSRLTQAVERERLSTS